MKSKLIMALLCVSMLSASFFSKKEGHGLLAYWKFDQISNGKIKDFSGNGLDAENKGCAVTDGIKGKALLCNGGFLYVPYQPVMDKLKNGVTISAWVFRDTSTSWNCVVTRETLNNSSEYYDIAVAKNQPLFSIDPDGHHFLKTNYKSDLPVKKWILLAGTFDNKTYKLYINGRLVDSGSKKMPFQFGDQNPIIIAGNTNDNGKTYHDFFYGKIDELRIYDYALNAREITSLASR